MVAGAVVDAGMGGAGAGDPDFRAWHRRVAVRSGACGFSERDPAVSDGGGAAAIVAGPHDAAARSAAAGTFHLREHVGGIDALAAGHAARQAYRLLQRPV